MRILLVVLATALTAGQLPGQALHAVGGASLVTTRVRSQVPAGVDQFTGSAFLGQGALALGRVELSASYLQGTINPDGGTATARDLVEGASAVGTEGHAGVDEATSANMLNWMQCVRSGKTPNADIEAGYSHSIALCMNVAAIQTGQKVTFEDATQQVMVGGKPHA